METLEEVFIFLLAITIVVIVAIYILYWSASLSNSYQISSLKTQLLNGVNEYITPTNITIINSQSPILVNIKIHETYVSNSKTYNVYKNYTNFDLNTGNNVFPFSEPNPTSYTIDFYQPSTNDYIYSVSGTVKLYFLNIKNLFSGTSVFINGKLIKLPTSVEFNEIPLTKSINNITILSKYFYIRKTLYLIPNQTFYNMTLPTNMSMQKLTIYGFNGINTYPLSNVSVVLNNMTYLTTNSTGGVSFPYVGNLIFLKTYYPPIIGKNYTSFSGIYQLPQNKPIILYNFGKLEASILLYYNSTNNEYITIPGEVFLTSNIYNYSMNVSSGFSSLNNITKNYYNAVITTESNKTYGYFNNIPILKDNQSICFRLVLNSTPIENYSCPQPPNLPPLKITFTEYGLPSSSLWNVTTINGTQSSTTENITIQTNKRLTSYNYNVGNPIYTNKTTRYVPTQKSGSVSVKNSNQDVPVQFIKQYYLNMTANTSVEGSVSPKSGWYNSSSSFLISAIPNKYYHFKNWIGNGNGSYSGNLISTTITMNGPITETANFAQNIYTIYFNETNLPSGTSWTVKFNNSIKSSNTKTIIFNTTEGVYLFNVYNVSINSSERYTPTPISGSINVTQNTTENIDFIKQFYLTMKANTSSDGTISPSSGWYNNSSIVEIKAIPNSNSLFKNWVGSGTSSYSGTNSIENITITSPVTEQANFIPYRYILKFNENGLSGQLWSVSLNNGNINSSTTNVITFNEIYGNYTYTPSVVNVNSVVRYYPNPTSGSVSLTSNITENIKYIKQYYLNISSNNQTMGSVSPSSSWYNINSSVPINAIPNSGYIFKNWTGSGLGSYSGTTQNTIITMNSPINEIGNFNIITIYNPTSGRFSNPVVYNKNTSLTNNILAYSITINNGVILTTNGYALICNNTFINNGIIDTGQTPLQNFPNSYGGSGGAGSSGGGGGSGGSGQQSGTAGGSGIGYNTSVAGGRSTGGAGGSGAAGGSAGVPGVSGATPSIPTLTNLLIQTWYNNGMLNYLAGAGSLSEQGVNESGGTSSAIGGSSGGNGYGAYGLYIQANQIIAGVINANGTTGSSNGGNGGNGGYLLGGAGGGAGAGAGGGGVIILAYGNGGYIAGIYNVLGGTITSSGGDGGAGGSGDGGPYSGGVGGGSTTISGGNGDLITYNYAIPPIQTPP